MKKTRLIFSFLVCFFLSFMTASATSTMTKGYYFNDFDGETISDANATISTFNNASAAQSESVLSVDVAGMKLYNGAMTITFTSPLDLTNNAMLTIEGKYEGLEMSEALPETAELIPRMFIKLIDENNKSTAGNNQVFNFGLGLKGDTWTTSTLDMKTYPGEVDFSKIVKMQVVFQAQTSFGTRTFTAGKFLFSKVELGELPADDVKIETSILTPYTFLNDFNGSTVNDVNQSSVGQSGKSELSQQDGRLDIYTANGMNAWQTYFRTAFVTPINMEKEHQQKATIKFEIADLKDTGQENVHIRMRIYDVHGTKKIVELGNLTDGEYERTITFGEEVYTEPTTATFDYTQVNRFEICSYNKTTTSGHIYLDHLLVGADLIPVEITFDSFTTEDGLTLKVNPKAPFMEENAFEFKELGTTEIISGITRTMLDTGGKFNFKNGVDVSKSYELTLNDTLYYLPGALVFSSQGMIKNVVPTLISASLDSIHVEFNRVLQMTPENFILKNKETGVPVTVDSVRTVYGGQEYFVFASLAEATDYTLEMSLEGYLFGEPLDVRAVVNPVYPVIDWGNVIGELTADHWGVNDNSAGTTTVNERMSHFYNQVRPGVIRLHHKGLVAKWVDNANRSWNTEKIKSDLDNAKDTYKYGGRVMITLDAPPEFIATTYPLTETQEDELAAFFAQLPGIISGMGHRVDLYEFLNEKEGGYEENYPAYWRMFNKVAIAMKTADASVKCGGPAVSWPTAEVYKGFIDNCSDNMDFVSFHLYARGAGSYLDNDLFTGKHPYRNQSGSAGAVAAYLKEKGITHMETFLDEFNVQYVWEPYEPAHHNHIGASWMACFIKNVAIKGVTGLNVWNTQDGAYGLNYNSAPANLYLMSRKYLRGDVTESADPADRVEMIPVINEAGEKSLLFINRTGDKVTVVNAKALIGGDESAIRGMRLDHTTNTEGRVYITETMNETPTDILLNPYGMVLLTNVTADVVSAPTNLTAAYTLENEVGLTWSSDAVTRKGFRVFCDDVFVSDVQAITDTVYVLSGLQPATTYSIKVATIDEYGDVHPTGETVIPVTTRKMPLKINDRTTGTGLHQFNYDRNWTPTTSNKKVKGETVYNGDVSVSKAAVSSTTVQFKGNTVVLYGIRTDRNSLIRVYIDDVLKKELTTDMSFGFDNMVYYDETLTDDIHTLKLEVDATFSLDRMDVFGNTFENVTETPAKVTAVEALPTTMLINLSWEAPAHVGGIQYYRVLTTVAEETRIDTIYSPEFTITGLAENTTYPVVIEAYDPCGNMSTSDTKNYSTTVKQSVEIAKAQGSITIDGVANEEAWAGSQRLVIGNTSGNAPESSNLSGWFKILWAQRYLYIYIDVTDDVKVARTDDESELNEHDGFELFIDGNNKKTGPYSLQDASIKALYNPIDYEEYNNVKTMEYVVSETATGYGIEIRYNLADLGMVPGTVGKELGLDIHLNDNDKTDSYGLDNKLTWQNRSENAALNKAFLADMIFVESVIISNPTTGNDAFSVYPNPVVDQLNLTISSDYFKVAVYNNQGILVTACENQKQINVSNLPSGIYVVQVTTPEGTYNQKLIKK